MRRWNDSFWLVFVFWLVRNLGYNQITGPIPTGLGSLTNLVTLNLLSNNMTGNLPADLGDSKTLTKL